MSISSKDFEYYFAVDGNDYRQYSEYLQGEGVLISYAFFEAKHDKNGRYLDMVKKHKGRVMMDSGGFTNFTTPGSVKFEAWLDFMKSEKGWVDEYIQFDDLKSRAKTIDLYEKAVGHGLKPLFVEHLYFKENHADRVNKIWKDREKVAIGGFGGFLPGQAKGNYRNHSGRLEKCFQRGRDLKTFVHLLGVGSLKKYMAHMDRIHSVDSASWDKAVAFGKILAFEPYQVDGWGDVPFLRAYSAVNARNQNRPMPAKVRRVAWSANVREHKLHKVGVSNRTKICNILNYRKYLKSMKAFDFLGYRKFMEEQAAEKAKDVKKMYIDLGQGLTYWDDQEEEMELICKQEARAAPRSLVVQANHARKEDKLTPGEFFFQPKPTRAAAPEEAQSVERFVGLFKSHPDWFPTYVQKKYDGARHQVHKVGQDVKIFSEDGDDNTDRLPGVVAEVRRLKPEKLVFDCEIEAWKGNQHLPREAASGYLSQKGKADDGFLVANVFDVLYLDQDIHGSELSERLAELEELRLPQATTSAPNLRYRLNRAPSVEVENAEDLERVVRTLRVAAGSEGVVAKQSESPYPLSPTTPDTWVKYHNATLLHGVVTSREETKGGHAWVYQFALLPGKQKPEDLVTVDGQELVPVGDTMGTKLDLKQGDGILVEAETVNAINSPDGQSITAWVPRVMGEDTEKPDTVDQAMQRAAQNLVLQVKDEDADGNTTFRPTGRTQKQEDPFMELPPEDRRNPFVVQNHFRGRSVHTDLRIGLIPNKLLIGWTLSTQVEGMLKEPVTTLAQAREVVRERMEEYSKINWHTGEWATRPKQGARDLVRAEIYSERKAPEPWEWLNVEGATQAPREGERPPVGGTRNFPGVFVILDQGDAEYGAQKPWFHEYFMHGRTMNYRLIFRQLKLEEAAKVEDIWNEPAPGTSMRPYALSKVVLPPSSSEEGGTLPGEAIWLAIRPNDQLPYVLGGEAVQKAWMPPLGRSALPRTLRSQVPEPLRYWNQRSEDKAREVRDALVAAMKAGEVKLDPEATYKVAKASSLEAEFVLQEQTWKGPVVIRTGPSRSIWWVRVNVGRPELMALKFYQSPLDNPQVSVEVGADGHQASMGLEGELKPGHYLNPTKDTPSAIDILDQGKASVLSASPDFIKIRLDGKRLKGLFGLTRNGTEWLWEPAQAAPDTQKGDRWSVGFEVPIAKIDEARREVTGVVLEPDEVDAQNDTITEEVITQAAHHFLADYNRATQMGLMHRLFGGIGVELYESWIAREDSEMNGQKVKKGSWLMTIHVVSDQLWERVRTKEITGFSIGGSATLV